MAIRDATEQDLPAILDIFNHEIITSTAVYLDHPTTLAERASWWAGRVAAGHPVLVSEDDSGVVGFASFGEFRARPGYRFTVEHSVYVRADRRGRGLGAALVHQLVQIATAQGKHAMLGGVDAENVASMRFHEQLGFTRVAHFREVGFKFARWLDLVFVEKLLKEPKL